MKFFLFDIFFLSSVVTLLSLLSHFFVTYWCLMFDCKQIAHGEREKHMRAIYPLVHYRWRYDIVRFIGFYLPHILRSHYAEEKNHQYLIQSSLRSNRIQKERLFSMATAMSSDNDRHPDDQSLESFCLIWLDGNPNEGQSAEPSLRSIINELKKFQDVQQCQDFIQKTSAKERFILIASGRSL